ncbi:MAG: DUF1015 domain-containing protein [Candidatus Acetothermia bacterium]|jgi:uncharacterized protein (DUF1015 family)|nr:DUF1015 domain-containing protein [Candidatus Acetothermia bacterium]MDH7506071.1 DUF1015 domain-containing protein [Candidatus Acetothermia bacterium]
MAEIFPFRGIRYNPERVDLSEVVTQPYDKISPEMQEEYYLRSPHNFVRLNLNRSPGERRYSEAKETLERWLDEQILIQDSRPTVYAYYQDYRGENRASLTRKGFIALFKLAEYGKGILPHERTLAKPKEDRLKLMRATRANLGQVFVLYSDPKLVVNHLLDQAIAGRAPLRAVDPFDRGTTHRLWPIQDQASLEGIVEAMRDKTLFIADGHHRYETALAFRKEMEAVGAECSCPECYHNVMLTFVNMDDRGLVIFPTHRLIHELGEQEPARLKRELARYFRVEKLGVGEREQLLAGLRRAAEGGRHAFGLALRGLEDYYLLELKDEAVMDKLVPDRSPEWRRLDVTICHYLLLDKVFGIGPDAVEGKVDYKRSAQEALELVAAGKEAGAILLNPTKVEEVRAIARNGERMPQKSTDFYPKMLSGLVLNRLCSPES